MDLRKVFAWEIVSLDGVIESPEQWSRPYFNEEMGAAAGMSMAEADTMLMGRILYEEWSAFWPTQSSNNPFADYLNTVPKFVVSTTLHTVEWNNSRLITGNAAEQIARLKQQPGKNISILGSATLVQSLVRDDLLDELVLLVHPVIVGRGKRLFPDEGVQKALKLVKAHTFRTGVVALTYQLGTYAV